MVYYVQNGETSSGIVQDYDGLVVLSGGVIINSEIKNSGYVDVSSGGRADSTLINDGDTGGLFIFDGGVANDVTVNSGGYVKVTGGGKARLLRNGETVASGRSISITENLLHIQEHLLELYLLLISVDGDIRKRSHLA